MKFLHRMPTFMTVNGNQIIKLESEVVMIVNFYALIRFLFIR